MAGHESDKYIKSVPVIMISVPNLVSNETKTIKYEITRIFRIVERFSMRKACTSQTFQDVLCLFFNPNTNPNFKCNKI